MKNVIILASFILTAFTMTITFPSGSVFRHHSESKGGFFDKFFGSDSSYSAPATAKTPAAVDASDDAAFADVDEVLSTNDDAVSNMDEFFTDKWSYMTALRRPAGESLIAQLKKAPNKNAINKLLSKTIMPGLFTAYLDEDISPSIYMVARLVLPQADAVAISSHATKLVRSAQEQGVTITEWDAMRKLTDGLVSSRPDIQKLIRKTASVHTWLAMRLGSTFKFG